MKLLLIFVTASISVYAQEAQKSAKQNACEKLKKYYETAEATSKLPSPNKPGSPTELDKSPNSKALGTTRKIHDAADKVTSTLDKTSKFVELLFKNKMEPLTKTMTMTKQVFSSLGTVAAFLGPVGAGVGAILSIISMFIPQPDPIDELKKEMKEGFAEMHQRFDQLNAELQKVVDVIQSTAIYIEYQKQNMFITYVMSAYKSFVSTPSSVSRKELIDNCNRYNPKNIIIWIKNQGTNPIGPALLATIIKDKQYDLAKIKEWFQFIVIDVLRATFLREVCLSVKYGENTDLAKLAKKTNDDDLLGLPIDPALCKVRNDLFEALDDDRKDIEMLVEGILNNINRLESNVKSNINLEQLQLDLDKFLNDKTYEAVLKDTEKGDHPAYCNLVSDVKMFLDKKYFYFNWGVHLSRKREHKITSPNNSHYFEREKEGRTLIVIWSEQDSPMVEIAEQKAEALQKAEEDREAEFEKSYTNVMEFEKSMDVNYQRFKNFWEYDKNSVREFSEGNNTEHIDIYDDKYSLYDNRLLYDYIPIMMLCQLQDKYIRYHKDYYSFTVYYDTKNLANTLACKGTYGEIKQALDTDNSTRQQHCSLEAFKTVTENVIYFYFFKTEQARTDLKIKQYDKVGAELKAHLDKKFEDIEWNVLIIGDGADVTRTSDSCKKSSGNCLAYPLKDHGHSLYIIWSSKESKLKPRKIVPEGISDKKKKIKEVIKNKFNNFKKAKDQAEVLDHAISFLTNHANYTQHNKPSNNNEISEINTGVMHELDKHELSNRIQKIVVVTRKEIYPPFTKKINNTIRFKFEHSLGDKYYVIMLYYKPWDS